MTQSSEYGRRRLFASTAIATDSALDPLYARAAVLNNLQLLADQACAKVMVNDLAADEALITGGGNAPEVPSVTLGTDEWRTVQVYGPFDISTAMLDGQRYGYRLRVKIYAESLDVTWAAQLVLADDTSAVSGGIGVLSPVSDCLIYTSTGSTSPEWLALATGDVLEPTPGLLDRGVTRLATLDGPSGVASAVPVTALCLRIMAKGSGTPQLWGVHAAEVWI